MAVTDLNKVKLLITQSNNEIRDSQLKEMMQDIKVNQDYSSTIFDDLNKPIELSEDHKIFKKEINILKNHDSCQIDIINKRESDVDSLQQKKFENNLIIRGLSNGTDPNKAIENIICKLNAECTMNDIVK